ncbi:hypothetical protein ACLEXP_27205, partial [Escherichia coli]
MKDVTDVHGAAEPIDFHEPDWHGGQCQSGSWKNAGKGDIEIVKVTASKLRWPGATATCPMG